MSRDRTQLVVADPLGAIRTELVEAARRRRGARRGRRRALTLAVAVVGLLAVASGAIALTNTATQPIRVFYGVIATTDVREVVGQRLELRFADGTTREVGS